MAGSWYHATTKEGKLLRNEDIVQMLENGGDWYEFAEEAYGMVWYLAQCIGEELGTSQEEIEQIAKQHVEMARDRFGIGLLESPGTDGTLKEKD